MAWRPIRGRSDTVIGHFSRMAENWGIEEIRPIDKCICIGGVPRSGTTACYKMLFEALRGKSVTTGGSAAMTESFYFESEANPSNEDFWRAKIAFLGGTTKYVDMFNYIEEIRPWHYMEITPTDMSRIYFEFVRQHYELPIPCEKTPSNILFGRRIFQNSRHTLLLFLVRHPASVLASMRHRASVTVDAAQWLHKEFEDFCWFYKFYIDKFYEMKSRFGCRVRLLRYEDLCVDGGLLAEAVRDILGQDIFRGAPDSRLDHGQSSVEIFGEVADEYYKVQDEILSDTVEYLGYGRLPPAP